MVFSYPENVLFAICMAHRLQPHLDATLHVGVCLLMRFFTLSKRLSKITFDYYYCMTFHYADHENLEILRRTRMLRLTNLNIINCTK